MFNRIVCYISVSRVLRNLAHIELVIYFAYLYFHLTTVLLPVEDTDDRHVQYALNSV